MEYELGKSVTKNQLIDNELSSIGNARYQAISCNEHLEFGYLISMMSDGEKTTKHNEMIVRKLNMLSNLDESQLNEVEKLLTSYLGYKEAMIDADTHQQVIVSMLNNVVKL